MTSVVPPTIPSQNRHPRASEMPQTDQLHALRQEKYLSLTTFRRDGSPVATPVWFVLDGDYLLVHTGSATGKVKRIRRTPKVTVAACTGRGRVTGAELRATASILPEGAGLRAERLFRARYPVALPVVGALNRIVRLVHRQPAESSVYLQITLC